METIKFIADNNLGKLVKILRITGFDTEEMKEHNHEKIINTAIKENRIILTKDNKIKNTIEKNEKIVSLVLIKENFPDDQLIEVIKKLNLNINIKKFFSRCTLCNGEIILIKKTKAKKKVPEHAFKIQEDFWYCKKCDQYYWAGTHWSRIIKRVIKVLKKIQ